MSSGFRRTTPPRSPRDLARAGITVRRQCPARAASHRRWQDFHGWSARKPMTDHAPDQYDRRPRRSALFGGRMTAHQHRDAPLDAGAKALALFERCRSFIGVALRRFAAAAVCSVPLLELILPAAVRGHGSRYRPPRPSRTNIVTSSPTGAVIERRQSYLSECTIMSKSGGSRPLVRLMGSGRLPNFPRYASLRPL